MKKVLLTSAVVLTAFGAYNVANAESVTVPSVTANTSTYIQTLKQKIKLVETGYTYGTANDAFSAGINLEGWFGKKRGATVGGSAHWKF